MGAGLEGDGASDPDMGGGRWELSVWEDKRSWWVE